MGDMDAAGMPLQPGDDIATWEAARQGVHAEPGSLTGGIGPFAETSAGEVHRMHSSLRDADRQGSPGRGH